MGRCSRFTARILAAQLLILSTFCSSVIARQQAPQNATQSQIEILNGQPRVFSRAIIPGNSGDAPAQPADPKPAPANSPAATPDDAASARIPSSGTPKSNESQPASGGVTDAQLRIIGMRAWNYLKSTQYEKTGLFDSVAGYHHATMWDVASGLAGLVCAEKLGVISRSEFIARTTPLLDSLQRMPLYNNELPNREYDIRTLGMLDAHSKPSARGSGWSSTDLGRLLVWLKIVQQDCPELSATAEKVVQRWKWKRLVVSGEAFGALVTNGREDLRQEGRLGYEQYAALGFAEWGIKLQEALKFSRTEKFVLYEIPLERDIRNMSFLTSEPFFLAALEIGSFDSRFDSLEQSLYHVQQQRFERDGALTAVSEDSISKVPWFVYNTVSAGRQPWSCVSPGGHPYPEFKSLSTKAAFALWALHSDTYAMRLFEAVKNVYHSELGYYAGIFETGGTNKSLNLNTNAIILESLLYSQRGRRAFLSVTVTSQAAASAASSSAVETVKQD